MLHQNVKSPIIYKTIPTQYAFLVNEDGTVNAHQVTKLPEKQQFRDSKQALEYINNIKEII